MAATYAPNSAMTYAVSLVSDMPVDNNSVQYRIMDDASKTIWNAAPWRWTLEVLSPVTLVANTSDYTISPSSTIYRIAYAYKTDGQTVVPLAAGSLTAATAGISKPSQEVTLISTTNLRVWPPPGPMTSTWKMVVALKKISPVITSGNAGTTGALVMDDEYYPVYQEWVNYYAMKWAYDSRCGGAQVDPQSGKITYAGQLGVAYAFLEEMRRRENISPELDYRPDIRMGGGGR